MVFILLLNQLRRPGQCLMSAQALHFWVACLRLDPPKRK